MLTRDQIRFIVADTIEIRGTVTIGDDTPLWDFCEGDNLGGDSLDRAELAMRLEEETGLEISDEAIRGFNTVADIHTYLTSLAPK